MVASGHRSVAVWVKRFGLGTAPRPATPHTTNQVYGFPDVIRVFPEQNPESVDPLPSGALGRVETPLPARRRREPGGGGR